MSDTILSAETHFEALREAVWRRFRARHRTCTRDAFEDAYAEWWAREIERAAAGRPSRAKAPAAFMAEAIHRVLIDDLRARGRGLAREEKGSLEMVELDAQLAAADSEDIASRAAYEAVAHRVLALVRDQLTARELSVFVFSYLYLQTTERTAAALSLSHPRVKKDRKRIANKVGREVWAVLSGELELCAAYEDKRLLAVFEILTVHVEDCPTCRAALGGVRRGALAIIGPAEVLVLGSAHENATHAAPQILDALWARANGMLHRATEAFTALPPNGRTAAAVAAAATAVAGGAATVQVSRPGHRDAPRTHSQSARNAPRASAVAHATATPGLAHAPAAPAAHPARAGTAVAHKARTARARRRKAVTAAPAREPISSFEVQGGSSPGSSTATSASASPAQESVSAPASRPDTGEFGFEQP